LPPNAEHNLQANVEKAAPEAPLPKLDCQVHTTLGIAARRESANGSHGTQLGDPPP